MKAVCYVLVGLSFVFSADSSWAAMTLQSYNAASHDRFDGPDDVGFIGNPYDWSGVGRGLNPQQPVTNPVKDPGRWATMISPSYFLSAAHFAPDGTLRFFHTNDSSGAFEDRIIASGQKIFGTDLWLGKLATPVSTSVEIYPILVLPAVSDYENRVIYTFGLTGSSPGGPTSVRLGRNQIDPGSFGVLTSAPSTGIVYAFDFDAVGGVGADESHVEPGDSGGPSFSLAYGQVPALVGIHWLQGTSGSTQLSIDTFVPAYIDEIQAAMIGETLTLVPEPNSAVLALTGALAAGVLRRKRRAKEL